MTDGGSLEAIELTITEPGRLHWWSSDANMPAATRRFADCGNSESAR